MKTLTFLLHALTVMMLVFLSQPLEAQRIRPLNDYLAELRTRPGSAMEADADKLETLAFQPVNLIRLRNSVSEKFGKEAPATLDSDLRSLMQIKGSGSEFRTVELIKVRLSSQEEIPPVANRECFLQFPQLRYVLFLCEYECDPQSLQLLIPEGDQALVFLFSISVPN